MKKEITSFMAGGLLVGSAVLGLQADAVETIKVTPVDNVSKEEYSIEAPSTFTTTLKTLDWEIENLERDIENKQAQLAIKVAQRAKYGIEVDKVK